MFLKHKQALRVQKAVCGWEIKWSRSHQYLPSFVSTCLSDTFLFFRMEKRAEAFPTHGPPPSMMLYVCVCVCVFSHCLRSEDTIGWQRNAEKLTRDTKDRERRESNTFLLFYFPCPLLSLLALQQLGARDEQSVPLQTGSAGGCKVYCSLRQKHTGPNSLLMMIELTVLEYCVTKRTIDLNNHHQRLNFL